MNKDELREKRNRTIESLNDIKAILGLDELYIDELEKELADAKKVQVVEHFEAYGQCRDSRRITELEQENADLKEQNRNLLESCEGATMMYKDLCKAKEIIKKYLSIGVGGKITQNYLDVTKEAEQFIWEEEN